MTFLHILLHYCFHIPFNYFRTMLGLEIVFNRKDFCFTHRKKLLRSIVMSKLCWTLKTIEKIIFNKIWQKKSQPNQITRLSCLKETRSVFKRTKHLIAARNTWPLNLLKIKFSIVINSCGCGTAAFIYAKIHLWRLWFIIKEKRKHGSSVLNPARSRVSSFFHWSFSPLSSPCVAIINS